MAPPQQPPPEPLSVRLTNLAQTLQFAWFIGHLILLLTTAHYTLATFRFSASNSALAAITYRLAFLSAAATYGIVVYKAYRARLRTGTLPAGQQGALKVLGDENVQYLLMALTYLIVKPIFFALLPFAVYSTFHFLTYLRSSLLPTVMPQGSQAISNTISNFVKKNYDMSMHLVSNLELFLWLRIALWCLVGRNSWVLLLLYTLFLRARYAQSVFVKDALKNVEARGDALSVDARVPEGVRTAWGAAKVAVKKFGEVSDVGKMLGGGSKEAEAKKQ